MQNGKQPLGVILGPTASGKTALGVQVAKRLGGQIVSADSMQVYQGLDIGSAKPTALEMGGIPHHLLDVATVDGPRFTVAEYQRRAREAIDSIHASGDYPIVVGGTGLYISAIISPLDFTQTAGDEALRTALSQQEAQEPGSLYRRLQQEDPDSARRLHPNDIKRIIRALEVKSITGKPIGSGFARATEEDCPYALSMIGLTMPRELLYARIEQRVEQMLEQGLLKEARRIWDMGLDRSLPSLQGLGYKQLFAYFAGEYTLEQAIEAIKRETRHFAKRQLTWFRRDPRISWLDITEYSEQQQLLEAACALLER